MAKLPQYLKQTKYKNPDDGWNGPFQYALETKDHYFEWLKKNPKEQTALNVDMQVQHKQRGVEWFDYYPIKERLLPHDMTSSRPFLVDVGGGNGHDLGNLILKFPELVKHLVLEEQQHVLDKIGLPQKHQIDKGVKLVPMDLFKEQPIKEARVYYLCNILHCFPDKQAKLILKNIRDAMADDSVLLLHEMILPDVNVSSFQARSDLMMMALMSGVDRTLDQYRDLLEKCGFEENGMWTTEDVALAPMTIIEAKKTATLNGS